MVPENDVYYDDFVCGSQTIDGALYGMTFLCACCFTIVICYNIFKRNVFSNTFFAKLHYRALRQRYFYHNLRRLEEFFAEYYSQLSPIILFGRQLHALGVLIFRIAVVIIVFGVPIYLLKWSEKLSGDFYYSTHTATYRWFWTFAYFSGQLPAVLILLAWMVVISIFFVYFIWVFPRKKVFNNEKIIIHSFHEKFVVSENEKDAELPPLPTSIKLKLFFAVMLNVAIIVVMNAVYIHSSDQDLDEKSHLVIQFGFAVFNVFL